VGTTEFHHQLRAARGGDEAAFTALFRSVQPSLLRYLGAMTGNLADGAAEDVASETWLQVVRGLDRFRGDEDGFRAWVFTIARARLVDARRRGGRLPLPQDTERMLADVPGPDDVFESVAELISTESALGLLRRLPATQREVVLLRYVVGLDVEQTARLVGKRPGAVRVTAHRALRRLEDLLGERRSRPDVTRSGPRTVRQSR
jgi:RNA polymerase sigma-70 factor, ECF subfamily